MRFLTVVMLFCVLTSCKSKEEPQPKPFSKVEIETLIQDSTLNVRALEVNEGRVVVATSKGNIYQDVGFSGCTTNFRKYIKSCNLLRNTYGF